MDNQKLITVAVFLIVFQILIFNSIDIIGMVPYPYLLLVLLLPLNHFSYHHLVGAFLAGIVIDIFSDSGGIQASSLLIVVQFRRFILNRFFIHILNKGHLDFRDRVSFYYLGVVIIIHHFFLYIFSIFDFQRIVDVVYLTFKGSITTFLFCVILLPFCKKTLENMR